MKNDMYSLLISEPWDFTGPDGENQIVGSISKIIDVKYALFKANRLVRIRDYCDDTFVVSPRFENEGFYSESNLPVDLAVNGFVIMQKSDPETWSEEYIRTFSKFVFIGNLHRH